MCTGIKHTSTGKNVLGVESEASLRAVLEPALERGGDRPEGDVIPGDARFLEQRDLERLLARLEIEMQQLRAIEQVNLVHARHRDQAEGRAELDRRARFLE